MGCVRQQWGANKGWHWRSFQWSPKLGPPRHVGTKSQKREAEVSLKRQVVDWCCAAGDASLTRLLIYQPEELGFVSGNTNWQKTDEKCFNRVYHSAHAHLRNKIGCSFPKTQCALLQSRLHVETSVAS